jgi:hypothetical protein
MKSYEWMVDYAPQTTWIEGHGIFIWLIAGGYREESVFLASITVC